MADSCEKGGREMNGALCVVCRALVARQKRRSAIKACMAASSKSQNPNNVNSQLNWQHTISAQFPSQIMSMIVLLFFFFFEVGEPYFKDNMIFPSACVCIKSTLY